MPGCRLATLKLLFDGRRTVHVVQQVIVVAHLEPLPHAHAHHSRGRRCRTADRSRPARPEPGSTGNVPSSRTNTLATLPSAVTIACSWITWRPRFMSAHFGSMPMRMIGLPGGRPVKVMWPVMVPLREGTAVRGWADEERGSSDEGQRQRAEPPGRAVHFRSLPAAVGRRRPVPVVAVAAFARVVDRLARVHEPRHVASSRPPRATQSRRRAGDAPAAPRPLDPSRATLRSPRAAARRAHPRVSRRCVATRRPGISSRLLASTRDTAWRRSAFHSSSVFGALCSVPSSVAITSTESHSASALGSITESMMSFTVDVGRNSDGGCDAQPAARTERDTRKRGRRTGCRMDAAECSTGEEPFRRSVHRLRPPAEATTVHRDREPQVHERIIRAMRHKRLFVSSVRFWSLLLGVFAIGTSLLVAQQASTTRNPLAMSADAIAAGRVAYDQACQTCHGPGGAGERGPALDTGGFGHGSEDGDLFRTIREGLPGTQMPAFRALTDEQVWQIVVYLRTLSGVRAGQPAPNASTIRGNRASGETLFFGKAGCASCTRGLWDEADDRRGRRSHCLPLDTA